MTPLEAWIAAYVKAWNSNEPEDIAALFTEDATYAPEPYKPRWEGQAAILRGWLDQRDEPGETTFDWEPVVEKEGTAVVRATTRYPDTTYSNLWIIKLAEDGRAREFAEYWMEHPRG
jgi:ketosteroid isomerase-like protein